MLSQLGRMPTWLEVGDRERRSEIGSAPDYVSPVASAFSWRLTSTIISFRRMKHSVHGGLYWASDTARRRTGRKQEPEWYFGQGSGGGFTLGGANTANLVACDCCGAGGEDEVFHVCAPS